MVEWMVAFFVCLSGSGLILLVLAGSLGFLFGVCLFFYYVSSIARRCFAHMFLRQYVGGLRFVFDAWFRFCLVIKSFHMFLKAKLASTCEFCAEAPLQSPATSQPLPRRQQRCHKTSTEK